MLLQNGNDNSCDQGTWDSVFLSGSFSYMTVYRNNLTCYAAAQGTHASTVTVADAGNFFQWHFKSVVDELLERGAKKVLYPRKVDLLTDVPVKDIMGLVLKHFLRP